MKTSDFDLLIEVKEDTVNRALAAAFYTSAFPTTVEGKVAVSQKLPPEMKYLGDVEFELRLKEPPTVDAIRDGALRLLFNIDFALTMLHGFRNEFDLIASVAVLPELQPQKKNLILDLSQFQVDQIVYNDRSAIPAGAVKALNEVIKASLKSHLLDKLENLNLTPFLKPLELPDPVEGIDAVVLWNNGKTLFFKGGNYLRYDVAAAGTDAGYPCPIAPDWRGVWADGIDAAMVYPNGKAYFFKGGWYVRYDVAAGRVDPGYPARIKDGWRGVWADGIDAAVVWNDGKAYFFKGHEYIRFDIAADRTDDGYPADIGGRWPGVWADGIDAGVFWNNGKAYFFRGDEYVQFDVAANKADPGYPRKTAEGWPGVWVGKLPLPVAPGGLKMIGERVIAAGANLFQNTPGDIAPVQDYTGGVDLWAGVPERAMRQVFDYAWTNTACHLRRRHWNETLHLLGDDKVRLYVNALSDVLTVAIPKLLTGGVLSEKISVDYLDCEASATVSVEKPSFDFLPGNRVRINDLTANIGLYLKVSVKLTSTTTVDTSGWIPDEITPWEDDLTKTSSTVVDLIDQAFDLRESLEDVTAELTCDLQKGIFGRITNLRLQLDLGVDLISDAVTWLTNQLAKLILVAVPPVRLFPPLLRENLALPAQDFGVQKGILSVEAHDYVVPESVSVQVEPGPVTIDQEELTAAVNVNFPAMARSVTPVPLFVANRNPKRMEVHRPECQWVEQIDQAYRVGYYVLNDAIHDGYDGCKYCLPEYHTR